MVVQSILWQDNQVVLLDQTQLPENEVYLQISDYRELADAIKKLKVRGAPAIGISAAFGVCLGAQKINTQNYQEFKTQIDAVIEDLAATRPTAVNLFWALDRMRKIIDAGSDGDVDLLKHRLLQEALSVQESDKKMCRQIGEHGANLLSDGDRVLTHCNAGALATGGIGTALGVIYVAQAQGKRIRVFADETRPLLQGARLTTWELQKADIDVTLICDNMAAVVMQKGWIDCVIVGADRIARNGDTANKIGTYNLAVLAKYHQIPFYVAAPSSTIDLSIGGGSAIPIEQREPEEIIFGFGRQTAPREVKVFNPAFDVTPAELITAIITENGIAHPPFNFVD
ncbi:MAG: S-methyl-5-thioribose-1-phosphate isomerase [bacterium]|nr:S-methyl-5-thioribose-1-phosphate isomerase [bacterium]